MTSPAALHGHLEPIGGLAGDMFCAAMLDAFPGLLAPMLRDLEAAGVSAHVRIEQRPEKVNGMAARQFVVEQATAEPRPTGHYSNIRARLLSAPLLEPVRAHTLGIFDHLAAAEASVHAVPVEHVHFHEVADWDSQADIVAAASLIHHSGVQSWSCGTLPLGGGLVQTEHGRLPVPAPATAHLLRGFDWHDDGQDGERVTPTGAAILRYLMSGNQARKPAGRLRRTGTGCGSKRFDHLPNIVRLLALETHGADQTVLTDEVANLQFEIDDMTPEELATALDRLREHAGVLDASYQLRLGKKGRPQFAVQVLAQSAMTDALADLCLTETSTLGVRIGLFSRRILRRAATTVTVDGADYPAKQAERPDGSRTAKVEADALAAAGSLAQRRKVAAAASESAGAGEASAADKAFAGQETTTARKAADPTGPGSTHDHS